MHMNYLTLLCASAKFQNALEEIFSTFGALIQDQNDATNNGGGETKAHGV